MVSVALIVLDVGTPRDLRAVVPGAESAVHNNCLADCYYVTFCRMFTDCVSDKRDTISYVIINPSYDVKLEPNDIM